MIRTCVFSLLLFVGLGVAYWFWFNTSLDSAALWVSIFVASLASLIALGTIWKGRVAAGDTRRIRRALAGRIPSHGHYAAFVGTVQADSNTMRSPIFEETCVAYEYDVEATLANSSDTTGSPQKVSPFFGVGLVPCSVKSPSGEYKLNGFPDLSTFSPMTSSQKKELGKSRLFVLDAERILVSEQGIAKRIATVQDLLLEKKDRLNRNWQGCSDQVVERLRADSNGGTRRGWARALDEDYGVVSRVDLSEKVLKPGDAVCLMGNYSAPDNAIVPDPRGKSCRVLKGDPKQLQTSLAIKSAFQTIGGVLGLAAIHLIAFWALRVYPQLEEVVIEKNARLLAAVERNDAEDVEKLLKRGAHPDAIGPFEKTGLALTKDARIAEILLAYGADPNDACPTESCLNDPARRNNMPLLQVLVEGGASLDVPNEYGYTPLMDAARYGNLDAVKLLVQAGAEIDFRHAESNKTALSMAYGTDNHDIVAYLQSQGARNEVVNRTTGVPMTDDGGPILTSIREYLTAVDQGDAWKLKNLFSRTVSINLKDMGNEWREIRPVVVDAFEGFTNGDRATVEVRGRTKKGHSATIEFQMVLENDKWKVATERVKF